MSSIHHVKTWPAYWEAIADGRKTFEIRIDDRRYAEGDTVYHHEWDPDASVRTGRVMRAQVGYVLHGPAFGLAHGFVVFAQHDIQVLEEAPEVLRV